MAGSRKVPDGCPLTSRQFEVLNLVCDGLTSKQIARETGLASSTVRQHMHEGYRALGATCCTQAVSVMGRNGWWGWQPPEEPTPLAVSRPFCAAINAEFDRWLRSGFTDQSARDGMRLGTRGACNHVGLVPTGTPCSENEPLRDLLHTLAAETLTSSKGL